MTMSAVAQRTIRELERLSQSGLDTRVFRHAALQQIRRVVPVDAAFFATTDPTTLLMTSAVTDEILRPHASHFLRNEFVGDDVNQFRALAGPDRQHPGHRDGWRSRAQPTLQRHPGATGPG